MVPLANTEAAMGLYASRLNGDVRDSCNVDKQVAEVLPFISEYPVR